MNRKIYAISLISVLLYCCHSKLFAQQIHHIHGLVKEANTGEPIIGAIVTIKGTKNGVVTDYEGAFSMKTALPLPQTLLVSLIGYKVEEVFIGSAEKPFIVRLRADPKLLKEVAVTDSRITERQRQAPLTVETMDAISIKETPSANFYEGLAHLKGVDMTSASIGFKIINTRGFNSTSPVRSLQLIDGVDNQSPGLNFSLGNFLGASELDIQKVDLIVGASGAYYGPNAFNGVINMQTKSPFLYPGLSVQMRFGERQLVETAIRYAEVFKNKNGKESVAYKINVATMSANDWHATNYEATSQSPVPGSNPGGYDATNRYGDEYSFNGFKQTGITFLGYGTALRSGYNEENIVDYHSRNLKINGAVHIKVNPKNELIISSSMGNGTTVYQGDNRFSLKDIFFFQNKIEIRKENKYYFRVYSTKENAGNSFDAYSTSLLLQNAAKSDKVWSADYSDNWNAYIYNRILPLIPKIGSQPPGVEYEAYANQYLLQHYYDSLVLFHHILHGITDTLITNTRGGVAAFVPGTSRFDSAYNSIISRTNRDGGSRFYDMSALYQAMGEYQFQVAGTEFRTGGSIRLYAPNSRGTIFLDTVPNQRIYNYQGGAYLGAERKLMDDHLKATVTGRVDKNQNFNFLVSPAASLVYTQGFNVFRFSTSGAIRNPTLTDQYINLNVGRATLLGNLHGYDSLVTVSSLLDAFNFGRDKMRYFSVAPIKPERVQTVEFGYRGNIGKKCFVDASYYYSWYHDFIGYKIGVAVDWAPTALYLNPANTHVYRVSANAVDIVTTQGFSIGINYIMAKQLGFSGNYSWNRLDRHGSTDPLIPAFNTPEHKFNIGFSGRDISSSIFGTRVNNWGYSCNFKWQQGFTYEGSPQFTGYVPAYGLFDAQVNKSFPEEKLTVKMGGNNLLNNQVIQVYGGPRVGRLAYISLLFDFGAL